MEQMELFGSVSAGADDVIADAEYPTTYRIDRDGVFHVTANVPGVGRIWSHSRFLWTAYTDVQRKCAAALAARPSTMF